MLQVHYARDAWQTNGLHVQVRLVVLSIFHVQSIFIRLMNYFIRIIEVYCIFRICFNSFLKEIAKCTQLQLTYSGLQVGSSGWVDPVNN